MKIINFEVIDNYIKSTNISKAPVSDSINYLVAKFEFDDVWGYYEKTVLFKSDAATYEVRLTGDKCVIPWEVLSGSKFFVSVYGTKRDVRITTNVCCIPLTKSGYKKGKTPEEPTPDIYSQILEEIKTFQETADDTLTIAKRVEERANNGEFKGESGYTPVKGIDYFTEDDKASIVNDTLAALPAWEGGSY